MKKKLSVNNLVISFRTPAGKVQAVRDISFDLKEGETLAVVGESGSGKSVTSKAILGILAGNSIVEGGSILYDGMDLLKITEEEFYPIRGDKIAMIFQDPLSSLNPIMRIGDQLTEAMLLKGKARQRSCREAFNSMLARLSEEMVTVTGDVSLKQMCADFDKFEFKHIELEQEYNKAKESAIEVLDEIADVLFYIEKDAFVGQEDTIREIIRLASLTSNPYVVKEEFEKLKQHLRKLGKASRSETAQILKEIQKIVERAVQRETPDFFSMGYYLTFSKKELPDMPIEELNAYLKKYMDENYMNRFKEYVEEALRHSAKVHMQLKQEAVRVIEENRHVFDGETVDKKACLQAADVMIRAVEKSIDKLEIHKDGVAYTFGSSLRAAIHTAAEIDKENIRAQLERFLMHYEEVLEHYKARDYVAETEELIAFFKENASGVVHKVTKELAKYKAIKLMEEVGIPDARKRYHQYPFEFSGGMRQRIVIAIALAANPDVLICDEPTTALDVTIQAQILELINKLKKDRNLSIIFITHDLGVVANMADRIAVMYAGKIVETGTAEDIFYSPAHPYTWALLSAMPDLETGDRLEAIPGTPPNMIYPPVGDAFAERNKYAMKIDYEMQPPEFKISDTHSASTWLLHPDAPKVELPQIIAKRIEKWKTTKCC